MNKLNQLAALLFLLLVSSVTFSQWVIITSGGTKDLKSISLYQTWGYAVGDSGIVRKTVNGGSIWSTSAINTVTNLNKAETINTIEAYIAANGGYIFKTTNGGTNWNAQTAGLPGYNYYDMDFINSTTGLVVGTDGIFSATANGGANWIQGQLNLITAPKLDYVSVDMIDNNISFIGSADTLIAGIHNSYIQRSTNNGVSYTNVYTLQSGQANPFVCIQFINATTGFAITPHGYIIKTTNGGNSWSSFLMNMNVEDAFFVNSLTGYACGPSGGLKKTTNGGTSWLWQNSPTTGTLYGIACIDSASAISVGVDGLIVKTDNGGTYTSVNQYGNEIPSDYSLGQNYPNPFNPSTRISFNVPTASKVKLTVYDILGNQIKVLTDELLSPGTYEAVFNASELPSGTYFYRLEAGSFTETKKMILIK